MRWFGRSVIALSLPLLCAAAAMAYEPLEFVLEIGQPSKKKEQRLLNEARAVASAGELIYVAETDEHRVVVLDRKGAVLQRWGKKGDQPGEFREPAGIAVDELGRVYVSDTGNDRIQVLGPDGTVIRVFGRGGSRPREFDGPAGIAAARGILYIADPGNKRVQVLTADGIFLGMLAVKTEQDEMKAPADVAVDVQNRIYVVDRETSTVRIFDPAGRQVRAFGGKGNGGDGFNGPRSIAVDGRGNIFVADTGNYKLKKFDQQGKLLGSVGTEGTGPRQFLEPAAVDVDRDGSVLVLDAEKSTIQAFSYENGGELLAPSSPLSSVEFGKEFPAAAAEIAFGTGKRLWGITGDGFSAVNVSGGRTIGVRGSEPGQLKGPRGIATDSEGRFWVADTGNDRVQKFSVEGSLLQVVGKGGSGEEEFDSPEGIAVGPRGHIVVADTGNARVQVFSPKGAFLGTFGKSGSQAGQFAEPVAVAVDALDNIYVADRGNHRIAKFDSTGHLVKEVGREGKADGEFLRPASIEVSPDGEVFVLDSGNARVQVFDGSLNFLRKFGSEGSGPGEFREPRGLLLEDGIRLYVGDGGNKRVQAFTLRHTPAVPKDPVAQPHMKEVQLTWTPATETYLEQYRVYRSELAKGPFTLAGTPADPFFVDRDLPSGKTFFYRVTGRAKEGNESAPSAIVSATTPKLVPAAPRRVKIEAAEKRITLSWLPNSEPFLKHYAVYRSEQPSSDQWQLLATIEKPLYVDRDVKDETSYYYRVTAVGREEDESPPGDVVFEKTPKATLSLPPLEVPDVVMGELFASAYKYYESHPLGTLIVKNNIDQAIPKVKVRFSIKDFMDFPTEFEIAEVTPGQPVEVKLHPVFNNRILEVSENTPLQSEIALTYFVNGEAKTLTRTYPVMLYERHAMTWDRKEKIGAFVTAKDPVVADFSRMTIQPYVDAYPNLPSPLVYARVLYDALGVLGLSYIVDPTSPFQQFSGSTSVVDYLQYPRDTLARKSGDCDDLTVLFAALLENIGIGTAVVDVPGHVFLMFNTGVPVKDKATLGIEDHLLVPHDGTMWVPVEMTIVGAPFTKAWQKAAEQYREWDMKKSVSVVNIQKAWEQFKPVTLPGSDITAPKVKSDAIEAKYRGELETLGQQRLANLSAEYLAALKKKPDDLVALGQLGILYAENDLYTEALEQFQKMLAVDKGNAVALNNVGNIAFLQGRLDDARQAYESAAAASPGDAEILVNLARTFSRMGKAAEAKKAFESAVAVSPRVLRLHGDVAAAVGAGK